MSAEDFEFQLRAQQGYARPLQQPANSAATYVDPTDGTVYEWDEKQKGWVPKVLSNKRTPQTNSRPFFTCRWMKTS